MSDYSNHTPRQKDSVFLKLKEKGDKVVIRICGPPFREPKIYQEADNTFIDREEIASFTEDDWRKVYQDPDVTVSEVYHWPVIDRSSGRAKFYTGTGGIFNQLKDLDSNENWGDPKAYDVEIERTESPGKYYYKVTALPNKDPLTGRDGKALQELDFAKEMPNARKLTEKQIDHLPEMDPEAQSSPDDDTSQDTEATEKAENKRLKDKKKDVVIEDIDDKPISLDDIPF